MIRKHTWATSTTEEILETSFECFADDGFAYLSPNDGSAVSLDSDRARDLLLLKIVETTGRPPSTEVLAKVLDFKRAQVLHQGPYAPVFRRIGQHDGKHYLDLCHDRKVVEMTRDGWKVVNTPRDVYFLRTGSKDEALPEPSRDGNVMKLSQIINAKSATVRLLVVWLTACLRPGFPYVVIALEGEAGSGKSTAAKVLKYLIDPCRSLLRSPSPTERDLAIASRNSHILAFDNIDKIKPTESEWYCRCATGGAFSSRSHYSMTEETVIPMHSPVILTGIEGMVERADMASRVALVTLERPTDAGRIAEADLWPEIERLRPIILGGLLDAFVAALRGVDSVSLPKPPRMIDFAKFITAAEDALPWKNGLALDAFLDSQRDLNEQALCKDRVALAIINLMEHRSKWEGNMTELLGTLAAPFGEDYWPNSPHTLSRRVKQALPLLRGRGITMVEKRSGGSRTITFYSKKEEKSVTSVTNGVYESDEQFALCPTLAAGIC